MNLLIISHTNHYISNGQIMGWGPTIREINFLARHFTSVTHIGTLNDQVEAPLSSLPYEGDNIRFVPIEPFGGESLGDKIKVLLSIKKNLPIIRQALKKADLFQFRAPTGIGTFVIPYLLTQKKPGWIKYAGNWIQENPPIGYSFQRWMLKHQTKFFVTINGYWPNQPPQCLSFENPCLTEQEREDGMRCIDSKNYDSALDFCFVGRLESAKGVHRIIEAFKDWNHERIGRIHLIGDGPERKAFELMAGNDTRFVFHGFVDRDKVAQILSKCHVFLFPSESEGFPKAIGEAANYGCVVVATDVSCISHYISHEKCGYLMPEHEANGKQLRHSIQQVFNNTNIRSMALQAHDVARKFTYEYYLNHIQESIIKELGFH